MRKWKVGDLVAVNKVPDGQLYQIYEASSNDFMKHLVYVSNGKYYLGGWLDSGSFIEPSKEQLRNYVITSSPNIETLYK